MNYSGQGVLTLKFGTRFGLRHRSFVLCSHRHCLPGRLAVVTVSEHWLFTSRHDNADCVPVSCWSWCGWQRQSHSCDARGYGAWIAVISHDTQHWWKGPSSGGSPLNLLYHCEGWAATTSLSHCAAPSVTSAFCWSHERLTQSSCSWKSWQDHCLSSQSRETPRTHLWCLWLDHTIMLSVDTNHACRAYWSVVHQPWHGTEASGGYAWGCCRS